MPQTLDNLTYTWNNSGTTFTGIKYNVTDTASASGSLLMDLQVGGSSKFAFTKAGTVIFTGGILGFQFSNQMRFYPGNGTAISFVNYSGTTVLVTPSTGYIGFLSGVDPTNETAVDVKIYRDAANTLAQRNGTNAQTKRLYGTYTDVSNYRRLTQTMSAGGVAEIKPEGAGTGASGNVLHISGLPTSNPGPGILWNDAGTVKVGT